MFVLVVLVYCVVMLCLFVFGVHGDCLWCGCFVLSWVVCVCFVVVCVIV